MSIFDFSPSRNGSRFGRLSSNMFFTRNTAKPKRVRHIEGLNGALICNVNDDPALIRSTSSSALGLSRPSLPAIESSRRVERCIPPTGFWNTYGVIQDTDRWRHELANLASASGLGIENDDPKYYNRPTTSFDQRSGAHYSMRTGRFNEKTGKSRGRTGSKHGTSSEMIFSVPENERDMWMLQVLCQILGTSSLEDVQSWLVSATFAEKEQARTMINAALKGLKESERTIDQSEATVDFNSLSNLVEKQKHEEKQASQKFMKESLNRPATSLKSIDEEKQQDYHLGDTWQNLINKKPSNPSASCRRSYSSCDPRPTTNNNNFINNTEHDEINENIDTIQLDEDCQQESRLNTKKMVKKPATPYRRSVTTFHEKHPIESLEFNDDDDDDVDDDSKVRRIRQLESKLSRQEERAKKEIEELHLKQSRLENALKMLTKQTPTYTKRRSTANENNHDSNTFLSNGISDSQNENEIDKQQKSININKSRDGNNEIQRPSRSYSGVWKPDASTLHRLQGN